MFDFPGVQKGCIFGFCFWKNGGFWKSQTRWKRSLLSNDSKWLVGFVVPKSWLETLDVSRDQDVVEFGGETLSFVKMHPYFLYSRKMYDVPKEDYHFFWGRFYSIPVFQSSFSSSFTSSPGRNSCDRYMTCDAVDGKHARNTKQSTPLGAVVPWALHLGGVVFFFCVCWMFFWLVGVLDSIC